MSEITVVTVAKDMSIGLAATLQSVKDQKLEPRHILIDGSNNNQMIDYVSHSFPRVRIIRQAPKGVYSAMNLALSHVPDSDNILFLNASDFFLGADALGILSETVNFSGTWAYGGVICFSPKKNVSFLIGVEDFSTDSFTRGELLIPHPSTLIPSHWIKTLGGFNEKLSIVADIDLAFRVFRKYGEPKHVNKVISAHELGGVSTTNTKLQTRELRISRIRNFPMPTLTSTLHKLSLFTNLNKGQHLGVKEFRLNNNPHFESCRQDLNYPKCCKKLLENQTEIG